MQRGYQVADTNALTRLYAEGEQLAAEARLVRAEAAQLWVAAQQLMAESRRLAEESSALERHLARLTSAHGFLDWTNGPQPR